MKEYWNESYNKTRKDAKTEEDLRKGGMNVWNRNRLDRLYHKMRRKKKKYSVSELFTFEILLLSSVAS
jgi:hypothetical protein